MFSVERILLFDSGANVSELSVQIPPLIVPAAEHPSDSTAALKEAHHQCCCLQSLSQGQVFHLLRPCRNPTCHLSLLCGLTYQDQLAQYFSVGQIQPCYARKLLQACNSSLQSECLPRKSLTQECCCFCILVVRDVLHSLC